MWIHLLIAELVRTLEDRDSSRFRAVGMPRSLGGSWGLDVFLWRRELENLVPRNGEVKDLEPWERDVVDFILQIGKNRCANL